MKRLVIIDGNAILHRAFHALPPLTDPEGNLINAVYGFTAMLLRIYTDMKPTHLAVAFDRPAPTFRKELFKGYQAKRPKMDDDLIPQIARVHEVVAAMGIPIYEKDGYEADDCIGTIVHKKKPNFDQIIVVTGDRDIFQLVEDDRVYVYMPTKGLSEAKLYGEKDVKERMGVLPALIPDLKALSGDASDNYPGIGGIGPKTAVTILNKFGSVENLYKQLDKKTHVDTEGELGTRVIEKLVNGKEDALLSLKLAVIRDDVPLDITLAEISTLNTGEARAVFGAIGFKTLLKRLTGEENSVVVKDARKSKKKDKSAQKSDSEQPTLF